MCKLNSHGHGVHSTTSLTPVPTTKQLAATNYHGWDQGYGTGGTPVFTGEFEQVARVTMYLMDDNGLDSCFGAAWIAFALRIDFVNIKHEENVRSQNNKEVTRASDP